MGCKHIIVVGGGPAGMMAALRAAQLKQRITIVEKNANLGKKLLLTGNGRCNLTNLCDIDSFMKRFSKNGEFLRDAFKNFFNQDLIDFFEKQGLKFKTESQRKVFPASERSESILEVLKKELLRNNVRIVYNAQAEDIVCKNNTVEKLKLSSKDLISCSVGKCKESYDEARKGEEFSCDALVLATGGVSYAATGSSGDGLRIAARLGHRIVLPMPGLVPLIVKEHYPGLLEGLTLKDIRILLSGGNKKIVSEIGGLLFTGCGISGPLVLTLSGQVADWLKAGKEVYAEVDLMPALSREEIEAQLLIVVKSNPRKTTKNMLKTFLPERFISVFLDIARISSGKIASYVTQEERKKIVSLFKAVRFTIAKAGPIEAAMITRGGISLKEVNPRTMESRLVKNLYFAGEILDVDADSGGFNLQAAFSTGYLAGQSSAGSFLKK